MAARRSNLILDFASSSTGPAVQPLRSELNLLPVILLHCSFGAFLVPHLSCLFSPQSLSSISSGVAARGVAEEKTSS